MLTHNPTNTSCRLFCPVCRLFCRASRAREKKQIAILTHATRNGKAESEAMSGRQHQKIKKRTEFLTECQRMAEIVSEAGGKATAIFITEKHRGQSVQTSFEYVCNNEEMRLEVERRRAVAAAATAATAAATAPAAAAPPGKK